MKTLLFIFTLLFLVLISWITVFEAPTAIAEQAISGFFISFSIGFLSVAMVEAVRLWSKASIRKTDHKLKRALTKNSRIQTDWTDSNKYSTWEYELREKSPSPQEMDSKP